MQLKPFLLDMWLDTYEHGIEFNLAASAGPHLDCRRTARPERRTTPVPRPLTTAVSAPTVYRKALVAHTASRDDHRSSVNRILFERN